MYIIAQVQVLLLRSSHKGFINNCRHWLYFMPCKPKSLLVGHIIFSKSMNHLLQDNALLLFLLTKYPTDLYYTSKPWMSCHSWKANKRASLSVYNVHTLSVRLHAYSTKILIPIKIWSWFCYRDIFFLPYNKELILLGRFVCDIFRLLSQLFSKWSKTLWKASSTLSPVLADVSTQKHPYLTWRCRLTWTLSPRLSTNLGSLMLGRSDLFETTITGFSKHFVEDLLARISSM